MAKKIRLVDINNDKENITLVDIEKQKLTTLN